MYGLSHEKCLCLIFLVALTVLSCSGFRIDNITMTDISKKNTYTSIGLRSEEFLERVQTPSDFRHRIRHHHRQPRAHMATTLLEPSHQNRSPLRRVRCRKPDIARKAIQANTVVLARSKGVGPAPAYTVIFEVFEKIKYPTFPIIDQYIKIDRNKIDAAQCHNFSTILVNALPCKKYILFLNSYGAHNYSVVSTLGLEGNEAIPLVIMKVTNPNFRLRPPKVDRIVKKIYKKRKTRLKLTCTARGLPIPTISWRHNGTLLRSSKHLRIKYQKRNPRKRSKYVTRRISTLVIRDPKRSDWGQYECTAHGINNMSATTQYYEGISDHSEKLEATVRQCAPDMAEHYCNNGGTCGKEIKMDEPFCVCADGFTGVRCESKLPSQSK